MIHDEHLEPEQIEAFKKAGEIMAEHFHTFIVIAQVRVDDGGEVVRESYSGSASAAIGLLEQYKHRLVNGRE